MLVDALQETNQMTGKYSFGYLYRYHELHQTHPIKLLSFPCYYFLHPLCIRWSIYKHFHDISYHYTWFLRRSNVAIFHQVTVGWGITIVTGKISQKGRRQVRTRRCSCQGYNLSRSSMKSNSDTGCILSYVSLVLCFVSLALCILVLVSLVLCFEYLHIFSLPTKLQSSNCWDYLAP